MRKANLIIRPEKLGDLVVATPVFRAFKETFPDQPLHLLTDDVYADAVRHDPYLDKIIAVRWKGRTAAHRESWRAIYQKLKPYSYQRAAILYYNCEGFNWLLSALRVPQVAQLGGTIGAYLWRHKQTRRKRNFERIHFSKYYLRVAALLQAHASDETPTLYLKADEVTVFRLRFPFLKEPKLRVIVHPFGHGSAPNYSLRAYAQLMEILAQNPELEVFVTGTSKEKELWHQYSHLPVRTDWIGTLSIREWMVAATEVDLVIAGSTGVTHVAGALGQQTIGIYCPYIGYHPVVWGPLGSNIHTFVVPENECRIIQPCNSGCRRGPDCDLSFAIRPEKIAEKAFSILQSLSISKNN